MSYVYQKRHGSEHLYFVAGQSGMYYLHPKGEPEKANITNVLKALKYVKEKHSRFSGLEYELVMKLPRPQRDEYLINRLIELYKQPDSMIDSLSEAKQIEVLGLRMEELQTRLRQIEEELQKAGIQDLAQVVAGFAMKSAKKEDIDKLAKRLKERLEKNAKS